MTLWIVAGSGPSLTEEVAELCRGFNVLAVNDAYKRLPYARALYAADVEWWAHNKGAMEFAGEKWSCWTVKREWSARRNLSKEYGVKFITGCRRRTFSEDAGLISFGQHSGFQAVNLAMHWGGKPIVLVGFDMRGTHFFGGHPPPLRQRPNYPRWIRNFEVAAKSMPYGVTILNATPDSALTCFPMVDLAEVLRGHQNGSG